MKRFLSLPLLLALGLGLSAAELRPLDDAALDELWSELRRTPPPKDAAGRKTRYRKVQSDLDRYAAEALRLLNARLREIEEAQREFDAAYEPRPHQPGEWNLLPIWEEIPEPVPALPEAKAVDAGVRYDGFVRQIEVFQEQLADQQRRNNKYVDIHQQQGRDGLAARAKAARSPASRGQTMQAIRLQQLLGTTLAGMQNVVVELTPPLQQCEAWYGEAYRKLDAWYRRAYEALPIKDFGETREKEGLEDLLKAQAALRYTLNGHEAATRAWLWRLQKTGFKQAIYEFNDAIGEFGWGERDNGSLFQGTYEEPLIAAAVNGVYAEMIRLSKDAKAQTQANKGRQEQYEIAMR